MVKMGVRWRTVPALEHGSVEVAVLLAQGVVDGHTHEGLGRLHEGHTLVHLETLGGLWIHPSKRVGEEGIRM
jgi:hypothetical protein